MRHEPVCFDRTRGPEVELQVLQSFEAGNGERAFASIGENLLLCQYDCFVTSACYVLY